MHSNIREEIKTSSKPVLICIQVPHASGRSRLPSGHCWAFQPHPDAHHDKVFTMIYNHDNIREIECIAHPSFVEIYGLKIAKPISLLTEFDFLKHTSS